MTLHHLVSSLRGVPLLVCFIVSSIVFVSTSRSYAYLIDFESVTDNTGLGSPITNQFAGLGVTFENATALTAGISLNELEFPPHSGQTVASNLANGLMQLLFATPVTEVAGYFTYNTPSVGLVLSVYDGSDNLLGTITSAFLNNRGDGLGDAGSAPNEQLKILGVGTIARLDINPNGGDFVLDDFEATALASIPEPGSLWLLAGGFMGLLGWKRHGLTWKIS